MVADRVEMILRQLEEAREGLFSYADDVWQGIDHRDAAKRNAGVAFIDALNEHITDLGNLTDQLEQLIEQYTAVTPRPRPRVVTSPQEGTAPHTQELAGATAHTLDESFTWKRPYGFTLRSLEVTDVATWRELYGALCGALAELDAETFRALPENNQFLSQHGHRDFARTRKGLREALVVGDGIFAEVHYSANSIRDKIKELLILFGVQPADMRIYLRQERNTNSDSVA